MTQQEIAEFIQTELSKLFPDSGVQVAVRKLIGDPTIVVQYSAGRDRSEWINGIIENDRGYSVFLLQVNKDGSTEIDPSRCNIHRVAKLGIEYDKPVEGIGAKFRKISAKSELDAAKKLIAWFTKNAEAIRKIPKKF